MTILAFLSACIVLATIIARGADHPSRPSRSGAIVLLRFHVEKLALLIVGASAGSTILSILAGLSPPVEVVALMFGTALWMLTHPDGWLAYVLKGRQPGCNELRPDP